MNARPCKVDGCERVGKVVRGMCQLHYLRWKTHGTTEARSGKHVNARPTLTLLQLLGRAALRSEVLPNGCWVFRGALSQGYGTIGHKDSVWRVHRLAYVAMVGPVPDGLTLDHLCRNRACWNPSHLEPVPRGLNVLRGEAPTVIAFREGRCLRGHDMSVPENVYASGRHRQCAVCARARRRRVAS